MTEPAAYLVSQEPLSSVRWLSDVKPIGVDDKQITPLYADSYEYPRVKMTQGEVDEFEKLADSGAFTTYEALELVHGDRGELNEYENLYKRLFDADFSEAQENQLEFARAWAYCSPEDIEIVPDMKWFVERNDTSDDHRFLSKNVINLDNELNYAALKKSAKQFDTKEEAELWLNPLTEAVQLPVED